MNKLIDDLQKKLDGLYENTNNRALHGDIDKVRKMLNDLDKTITANKSTPNELTDFVIKKKLNEKILVDIDKIINKGINQLEKKPNKAKGLALAALKTTFDNAQNVDIRHENKGNLSEKVIEERKAAAKAYRDEIDRVKAAVIVNALNDASRKIDEKKQKSVRDAEQITSQIKSLEESVEPRKQAYAARENAKAEAKAAHHQSVEDAREKMVQRENEIRGQWDNKPDKEKASSMKQHSREADVVMRGERDKLLTPVLDALDKYKGQHNRHRDQVIAVIDSNKFEKEPPHIQQRMLITLLEGQLKEINAGKKGLKALIRGDYTKLLDAQLKSLRRHKVDYDLSVTQQITKEKTESKDDTVEKAKEAVQEKTVAGLPPLTLFTPGNNWKDEKNPRKDEPEILPPSLKK